MEDLVNGLIGALFLLGLGSILLSQITGSKGKNDHPKKNGKASYICAESLLTPPEVIAFRDLAKAVRGVGYVCPKVRIADLVNVDAKGDRSAFASAFGKISAKHVDFAVIKVTGEILFAVEIDDKSHERPHRKRRDRLVNAVFEEAEIPLVRLKPGTVSQSKVLQDVVDAFRPPQSAGKAA